MWAKSTKLESLSDFRRLIGIEPEAGDDLRTERIRQICAFNDTWGNDPLWQAFSTCCAVDEYTYSIPRVAQFVGLCWSEEPFIGVLERCGTVLRSHLDWDGSDGMDSLQTEVLMIELSANHLLPSYEGFVAYHKLCEALNEEADLLFLKRESSLRRAHLLRSHARGIVTRWCFAQMQRMAGEVVLSIDDVEPFETELDRLIESALRRDCEARPKKPRT